MKLTHKILLTAFLSITTLLFAAETPPVPPGGGGGVSGPGGAPASPIDLYVYALAIVAMLFIVYYARRTSAIKTD